MLALAAIFLVATSASGVQSRRVEVCELNHVLGSDGDKIVMSQIILWRWVGILPSPGYRVAEYDVVTDDYVSAERMSDGHTRVAWRLANGMVREVVAVTFHETVTLHDPEVEDRRRFATKRRIPYFASKRK